jgi:hypothetical protein
MMLNCGTAMSGERWGRGGRDAYGVCNKRWITIEGILIESPRRSSIFAGGRALTALGVGCKSGRRVVE